MVRLGPLFRSGHGIALCMSMLICCGLSIGEARPDRPCICPLVYRPVCGEDGKTYSNACVASCAGVKVVGQDECGVKIPPRPSCICFALYKPVCGNDGTTYPNSCEAGCKGIVVDYDGECTTAKPTMPASTQTPTAAPSNTCVCTKESSPVCGADGTKYGNICLAKCAGEKKSSLIKCPMVPPPIDLVASKVNGSTVPANSKSAAIPLCLNCKGLPDQPVCGQIPYKADEPKGPLNTTFGNSCEANCYNAIIIDGKQGCQEDPSIPTLPPSAALCDCVVEKSPVCDKATNNTYSGPCAASCAGVSRTVPGACKRVPATGRPRSGSCICTADYTPVCAKGVQYSNSCRAACAGLTSYTKGACANRL